jgi:hypothetical protein
MVALINHYCYSLLLLATAATVTAAADTATAVYRVRS